MKRTIINAMLLPILMLLPAVTLAMPAYAACGNSTAAQQVSTGIDETSGASCDDSQVNGTIRTAVTILSLAIGATSIIVIMISAFKYIVSGGEQNKVANAKSSLIYAMIGLAVAAMAEFLVHFVLYQANHV